MVCSTNLWVREISLWYKQLLVIRHLKSAATSCNEFACTLLTCGKNEACCQYCHSMNCSWKHIIVCTPEVMNENELTQMCGCLIFEMSVDFIKPEYVLTIWMNVNHVIVCTRIPYIQHNLDILWKLAVHTAQNTLFDMMNTWFIGLKKRRVREIITCNIEPPIQSLWEILPAVEMHVTCPTHNTEKELMFSRN